MLSRYGGKVTTQVRFLIFLVIMMLILPSIGSAALNGNPTIQISVPASPIYVNDIFSVVIKVSNIEITAAQIALRFNSSVVKVVDASANTVPDETAGGLTQANNDGISVMAIVNNTQGLIKYALMWFASYIPEVTGSDFLIIRFKAVAAGNPDIHFATNTDEYFDTTAASGYVVAKDGENTTCTLIQPSLTVLNRVEASIPQQVLVDLESDSNSKETAVLEQTQPKANANNKLASPVNFNDTGNHWAKGSIERLVASGTVKGYSDGSFKPDARITRAEFAAILANALGLETDSAYRLSFTDASGIPLWAQPTVAAVVKRGIVGGYADGSFRAGSLVTRAEIAAMAAKALQLKEQSTTNKLFADNSSIPNWARDSVMTSVQTGIISGYGDNTFRANNLATRAEAITIVVRMMDYQSKISK